MTAIVSRRFHPCEGKLIYVLYGEDTYTRQRALERMKARLGDPALASLNTTLLEGDKLTLGALQNACDTLPFLTEKRLVVVRNLLSRFEPPRRDGSAGEGAETSRLKGNRDKELVEALQDYLPKVPPTTALVFLEDRFSPENPLFPVINSLPHFLKEFSPPQGQELHRWIKEQVEEEEGGQISPEAAVTLAAFMGNNLQALSLEISKLVSYTGGTRPIQEADVHLLVGAVQEATVFQLADAIAARNRKRALETLHILLNRGVNANYILVMIARQFRILLEVKELIASGVAPAQIQSQLGLHPFVAQKAQDQARAFPLERLEGIYKRLLTLDTAIKQGRIEPETALDILVTELTQ